jgi:hypothetical protein
VLIFSIEKINISKYPSAETHLEIPVGWMDGELGICSASPYLLRSGIGFLFLRKHTATIYNNEETRSFNMNNENRY